jgi:predicted DCC family thiol-disulfide oxidoreductase YuxK
MSDIRTHAICSPSGAAGWMRCAGWRGGTEGNEYSREGTAAHELGQQCLETDSNAADHIGRVITVEGQAFTVDADMAEAVQRYVDLVRQLRDGTGGELLVEQRLPIDHITGEDGAKGTSDAVVVAGDELIVADLKFGRGVEVDAVENEQLQMYALGALREFELVNDFKTVRMVVIQPRLHHVSEWSITVDQLRSFGETARVAASAALNQTPGNLGLQPGEKQCRWCANKAACPALADFVEQTTGADFDVVDPPANLSKLDAQFTSALSDDYLATAMSAADLIEHWLKAVRAEVERRLLAGKPVPGFKLVLGKQGNRKWVDEDAAIKMLRETFRLPVEKAFDLSPISPTTAEKLHKAGDIGPRQWPKLAPLIGRAEAKPSVAPASDKRDAWVPPNVADDFEPVAEEASDLA